MWQMLLIIFIIVAVAGVVVGIIGYFSEIMVNDADIANSWDGIDWSKQKK